MTARVRAKFQCSAIEDYGMSKKVSLKAIYAPQDTSAAEDKGFTKATPWGEIAMTIDNPAAAIQFKPGRLYYLDFAEAPKPEGGWADWAYQED